MVILVGGMGMLVIASVRQQPRISDRAHDIARGRAWAERLTRELREGSAVTGASGSSLTFRTYVRSSTCGSSTQLASNQPAIQCRAKYSCTGGTCTRKEFALTGAEPATGAVEMVGGLMSDAVFTYSPSATDVQHVSVTLTFPSEEGGEGVTISDGAELRNAG